MRIVILAAGQGRRLLPKTAAIPKAMVPIAGIPLLLRTVRSLHDHPKVSGVTIVGGYRFEVLTDALRPGFPTVELALNERYRDAGPQASVLAGTGGKLMDGLLLMNGDTLYEPALLAGLLDDSAADAGPARLFGSRAPPAADDVNVVLGKDGGVGKVGKSLGVPSVLKSCGILHVRDAEGVQELRRSMAESLSAGEATWHGALNRSIARGWSIAFREVPAEQWLEIDDLADLDRCEAHIRRGSELRRSRAGG